MNLPDARGRPESKARHYRRLALYSSVIFLLPATLFGGWVAGRFLDNWLETQPWLTFLGLLLGGVAGFVELFRLLRRAP